MRALFAIAMLSGLTAVADLNKVVGAATAVQTQAPDDGSDVVEIIEDGPSLPPPSLTPAAAAPVNSVELRGWTRARAYGSVKGLSGARSQVPAFLDVPLDRSSGEAQLFLRMRYARARSLEAVVSGLLTYGLFDRVTLGQGSSAFLFSRLEPSLREAYLGMFWEKLDIRLGQQRVPWGKGDVFVPNDILNPVDLRDPIFAEREAFFLPSLMARADLEIGDFSLQAVIAPFFRPNRLDVLGSNWAIIQPGSDVQLRALANIFASSLPQSRREDVQNLVTRSDLPADDFSATSAGLRAAWSGPLLDLGAYYHYGWTQTPEIHVSPWVEQALLQINLETAQPADLAPLLGMAQTQGAPLELRYRRRHHVGAELATTGETFAFRLDVAYQSLSVFYTQDLRSFTRPTLQSVLAWEYQTGDVGKVVLVEAWYQRVLDHPKNMRAVGVLSDTLAVSTLVRWTFLDHLEVELRPNLGLRPVSAVVQAQVGWRWSGGTFTGVGGLWMHGEPLSLGHFYQRNQTVYLTVKHAF